MNERGRIRVAFSALTRRDWATIVFLLVILAVLVVSVVGLALGAAHTTK